MLSGFANLGAAVACACESANLYLDSRVGATDASWEAVGWPVQSPSTSAPKTEPEYQNDDAR